MYVGLLTMIVWATKRLNADPLAAFLSVYVSHSIGSLDVYHLLQVTYTLFWRVLTKNIWYTACKKHSNKFTVEQIDNNGLI